MDIYVGATNISCPIYYSSLLMHQSIPVVPISSGSTPGNVGKRPTVETIDRAIQIIRLRPWAHPKAII